MGQTVSEKIFDSHYVDNPSDDIYVLRLDAVFCGIASGFAFGYDPTGRSVFSIKIDRIA
jgi:hypothetical protein